MCIGLQPCKTAIGRHLRCCGVERRGDYFENGSNTGKLVCGTYEISRVGIEDSLPKIKSGLEEKYEAIMKRELYTKSKTAKTQAEREEARKAYLDKVGMHRDFRW